LAAPNEGVDTTVVSFDNEKLLLVDDNDQVIGYRDKVECHQGQGVLHRAFSLFLFDRQGRLLLQQRAAGKPLWALYWSNTCCSHPRKGETMVVATERRLREELGMQAELHYLYRFQYHAQFGELGAEHELCWVYAAITDEQPKPNPTEVAAYRWVTPAELDAEFKNEPDSLTPWFKLEWASIRQDYPELLQGRLPEQLDDQAAN
jgi:isopentenyl-diphosphate delta-isomerase